MIRHEYETIYVTRPDLEAEEQTRIDERLQATISKGDGEVLSFDNWGRRKLAYPIRRHLQGTYQYLHFVGPAELMLEIERVMNLEDSLIRYITVKLEENIDLEEVRAGLDAAAERRARLGLVASDDEDASDDDSDDDSSDDDTDSKNKED
ncbi:MAG: 30S ribosomal protein S6 [Alphaproteobacteria bacterium]|nr:30S ribosomal protein S6 [Alphaproteobacteria bacterium]